MAKVPIFSRLDKGDFDKKDQDLVDRMGYILNPFMEQTSKAFDKKINNDNLNQEYITFNISVDAAGTPSQKTQLKSNLNTAVIGTSVIQAKNTTTPSNYPIATPFISFTQAQAIVTINNISGLQAGDKYSITILSMGS